MRNCELDTTFVLNHYISWSDFVLQRQEVGTLMPSSQWHTVTLLHAYLGFAVQDSETSVRTWSALIYCLEEGPKLWSLRFDRTLNPQCRQKQKLSVRPFIARKKINMNRQDRSLVLLSQGGKTGAMRTGDQLTSEGWQSIVCRVSESSLALQQQTGRVSEGEWS